MGHQPDLSINLIILSINTVLEHFCCFCINESEFLIMCHILSLSMCGGDEDVVCMNPMKS